MDYNKYALPTLLNLKGKAVLLRVDFNLSKLSNGNFNKERLLSSIPFISSLQLRGARIVLISHFGDAEASLCDVFELLLKEIPNASFFQGVDLSTIKERVGRMRNGEVLLLENIRRFDGEVNNESELATSFGSFGDIFVNDAFSVSHRKHAMINAISFLLPTFLGPTFLHELNSLKEARSPALPCLVVLGGAKISTKLPLIEYYLDEGHTVYVAGALAHNIWRSRGIEIGKSLHEEGMSISQKILANPKLLTPCDVITNSERQCDLHSIRSEEIVVDIGKDSLNELISISRTMSTVIHNGPLGKFDGGNRFGSEMYVNFLASLNSRRFLGGGDTLSLLLETGLTDKFTFVSLGGGAMLEYLAKGSLPGLEFCHKV